jgi:hypothetical protein
MFSRAAFVPSILIAMVVVCTLGSSAMAQHFQGGLNFQLGFPTGDYKDHIDNTGVGVAGDILYSPKSSPLGIGLSLGFFQIGEETQKGALNPQFPQIQIEVNTRNNLAQFMLLLRAQPKRGPILPYVDGLVGVHYLFTESSVKGSGSDEDFASTTNQDDATFAWGGGGGVMIKVYDGFAKSDNGKPVQVFIDLRARYISGGEAEYLKEGSIRNVNGVAVFDLEKSKTNIATAHIGVAVNF